jgi:hypothetical protein
MNINKDIRPSALEFSCEAVSRWFPMALYPFSKFEMALARCGSHLVPPTLVGSTPFLFKLLNEIWSPFFYIVLLID